MWDIVDKPKDKKVVRCRGIFIVKCKSDGTLDQYKARLVAKDCNTQDTHDQFATNAQYIVDERYDHMAFSSIQC